MNALVQAAPYAIYAAQNGTQALPYMRQLEALGSYARAAASGASYASRMVKRAKQLNKFAKRRKLRRAKNAISQPYSSVQNARSFEDFIPSSTGYNSIMFKNLHVVDLKMPKSQRLTDQIHLKGFKICFELFNATKQSVPSAPFPIEVHFAIVQLGDETVPDIKTDFFRGTDVTTGDRSFDFVEYATDDTYNLKYKCNPLNPDNKRILCYKKWLVEKGDLSYNIPQSPYYVKFDKYVKIDRTINFDTSTDNVNEKPFKFCFWAMPVDGNNMPSTTNVHAFRYQMKQIIYYRNVT